LTDDARAVGGTLGAHWGLYGMIEMGLHIGCHDHAELQSLLDQARRDLTEMQGIDSACTIRWLGLKARLEWHAGRHGDALESALTGASASQRIRHCGFWAHEGFAGIIHVLLHWRARERAEGRSGDAVGQALARAMQAMRAHTRRFPPAASRWHQLQALAALDAQHPAQARRALQHAVHGAERYGMLHELARSCELLAQVDDARQQGRWRERAERLYVETGAHGDLRRLRGDTARPRAAPAPTGSEVDAAHHLLHRDGLG
jgi:hypothetical protein